MSLLYEPDAQQLKFAALVSLMPLSSVGVLKKKKKKKEIEVAGTGDFDDVSCS